MKTKSTLPLLSLALGLTFSLPTGSALAQGTAFTYQGRLDSGGTPFNGSAEFQATLWTAATGGAQVAANNPTSVIVGVTNGLFTLPLDFGANFPGADRWLQLEVRTSIGAFTTLSPRQAITPTPYAIQAGQVNAADVVGTLSSGQLGGTYSGAVTFNNAGNVFTGNGSGLTGVNAASVGGVSGANIWKLSGNSGVGSGQFLGTTDNQPLELRVNGMPALRLVPNTNGIPNVIGGTTNNTVATGVYGASIGGGFNNKIHIRSDDATIGGGAFNEVQTNAYSATISGGFANTIWSNATQSTIGGGNGNRIQPNGFAATIGGGWNNVIRQNGAYSTISGGRLNAIETNAYSATIGGGEDNTIQTNASYATIGGGWQNTIQTDDVHSTIGGGFQNRIQINAAVSTIGGGAGNTISANSYYATISGGWGNTIQAYSPSATIPGGEKNSASSHAFAAGYRAKANHTGSFVWADYQESDFASTANHEFNIRAQNGVRIQANKGIHLDAQDAPIIVRDWDLFATNASGSKAGIGRWGLFMEPSTLTVGIPSDDVPNRYFQVAKYNTNGTATALMTVNQAGDVTAKSFNPSSDRHLKENFAAVSPEEVLAKVAALPISRWNFKGEAETPHLGPMAQDFHAAFGLGTDDKHIATVDADGVALAAIQGLNRKLETEATTLRAENAELRQTVNELKILVQQLNDKLNAN